MTAWLNRLDERFRNFLRSLGLTPRTERWLGFYTRLGDGWIWGVTIAILFGWTPMEEALPVLWQGLLAGGFSLALYWPIKLGVRRPRPYQVLPGVAAEVPPLDKFSFPSGHTMNNLAAGLVVFAYSPWLGWPVVFMPLSWGVLRVYFGVHYLSDIVGGAVLGWVAYRLAILVFGVVV